MKLKAFTFTNFVTEKEFKIFCTEEAGEEISNALSEVSHDLFLTSSPDAPTITVPNDFKV